MGLSKKKIYFIVFLSIAILCTTGFLWAWFVTRDIRKNVSGALNQSQKVIVKNLILTETKEQKKYWELYAKTGAYESSNKVVILTEIIGNFYDKDNNVALSFESPLGTYEDLTKTVTLQGETLIVSKDGSSILADNIEWGGKNSDIIATGNVRIKRNKELATISEKAVFNSDLTFFKIIGNSKTMLFAKDGEKQKDLNLFQTKESKWKR